MSARYFSILFPEGIVKEPVIYSLVRRYGLVTNIYRASVTAEGGWMVASLEGRDEDIDAAMMDLKCRGAFPREGDESLLSIQDPPHFSAIRVRIYIPKDKVGEPLLSDIIAGHDIVINVRQADIGEEHGKMEMEISGTLDSIDKAVEEIKKRGAMVNPIEGNVIE